MNQRPNVLLVDDQKLTHAVIGKALAEMDLNLISAYSGAEALRTIRNREISLVLMDLMMPGMNGIETTTRIREELAPGLVPVIFITAASQDEEAVRQAYEMGAVDFLYKPISPAILKAKVGVFAELHRQRMALEQRQEEYRDIIEAVATGILTLDMNWRIVEANDSACAQFQIEREELLGKQLSTILGREGQSLSDRISQLLDQSVAFSMQSTGRRADGTTFMADVRGSTIMLQGAPCVLMCVNDVSSYWNTTISEEEERGTLDPDDSQRLNELREAICTTGQETAPADDNLGAIAQALLKDFPCPVYVKDAHGVFVDCNRQMTEMFGIKREELVGQTVHSLLPEQTAYSFEASDQTLLTGRLPAQTFLKGTPTRSGEILHLAFHKAAFGIRDGMPEGIVGVIVDLTEYETKRRRIQEEQHLMNQILTGLEAAYIVVDQETDSIEDLNPVAETLLQEKRENLLGTSFTETICPQMACQECKRCREEPIREWHETEVRLSRGDGLVIPVRKNIFNTMRHGRQCMVMVLCDISRRKILEQQLSVAQRLESIGQLASGIAHEINTPIQYVGDNIRFLKGAANDLFAMVNTVVDNLDELPEEMAIVRETIEDRDYPFLTQEIPQAIEQSLEGVNRVAAIVRSMKQFSHPGNEEMVPFDLNVAVRNTIMVARNEWKYSSTVATDLDPALPPIVCNPADINLIILNLLVNAAHALSDIYGEDDPEKGTITISTRKDSGFVELTVSDNGPGIPEENIDKIYNPFFTTKEVGRGTGQGLALVHSAVVDRHSGSIKVETAAGKGTAFRIALPISQASQGESS